MIRLSLQLGRIYLFDLELFSPTEDEPEVREFESSSALQFGFVPSDPEPDELDDDIFEDVPDEMRSRRLGHSDA